jgi:DNA-binding CsgD family transcriptional regulator
MTQIRLLFPELSATFVQEDPRPPREVMVAINTRQFEVGRGLFRLAWKRQSAMVQSPRNVVTVTLGPPPVELSPRHYQVLFRLAEYAPAGEIAAEMGISRRTVYEYTNEIKSRFGVGTKEEAVALAMEYGLVDDDEYTRIYPLLGV